MRGVTGMKTGGVVGDGVVGVVGVGTEGVIVLPGPAGIPGWGATGDGASPDGAGAGADGDEGPCAPREAGPHAISSPRPLARRYLLPMRATTG